MNIASTVKNAIGISAKKTFGAALLGATLLLAPGFQTAAHARVFFSVTIAPPVIPVYEQPYCPGEGYIWTPGYWAWTDDGYQWVDGAWVTAPYVGALWTPGYWGYNDGVYLWNAGYWGREVGYYGGINYGYGYFGTGFYGGYWGGNRFFYNRAYGRFDRGFRGEFYERRERDHDWRPGGEAYARNDRGFRDDHRGSFAGGRDVHDDHRDGNRGNFDQGRNVHDDHREGFGGNGRNGGNVDQQRGLGGFGNNRQSDNGYRNQGNGNDARRGFPGGQDRGQDNRAINQPQQTYTQPRQIPSQQPAPVYGGNRGAYQPDVNRQAPQQGFPGGNQNPGAARWGNGNSQQYRPAPDQSYGGTRGGAQSNAVRSNTVPMVMNNGGGRGNPAPAPAPQQGGGGFRGGAPANNAPSGNQGGGGFRGGDNRGGDRGGHR